MHVMHHLVFRACQPVDDFDGIFTDFATRAENLNFVFRESVLLVPSGSRFAVNPVAKYTVNGSSPAT
jgi:hypothetical protein